MRKYNDTAEKLVLNLDPKSPIADAYRVIRTNIQFARQQKGMKVIVVTSPNQGEGKSITSANLALVMAQNDVQTVYVDADLRKPNGHHMFGLSNLQGVTSYLTQECVLDEITREAVIPNLSVVTSGSVPSNPADLLGSERMVELLQQMQDRFEIVILDSPPMLVSEASILAGMADGCILVVDAQKTKRNLASKAIRQLRQLDVNILGVVLNKQKDNQYAGHYSYH